MDVDWIIKNSIHAHPYSHGSNWFSSSNLGGFKNSSMVVFTEASMKIAPSSLQSMET